MDLAGYSTVRSEYFYFICGIGLKFPGVVCAMGVGPCHTAIPAIGYKAPFIAAVAGAHTRAADNPRHKFKIDREIKTKNMRSKFEISVKSTPSAKKRSLSV